MPKTAPDNTAATMDHIAAKPEPRGAKRAKDDLEAPMTHQESPQRPQSRQRPTQGPSRRKSATPAVPGSPGSPESAASNGDPGIGFGLVFSADPRKFKP
jgi:hypothetical protein